MSTGKRLAKRSIIGTRVCAPGEEGKYFCGVIQAVKTPAVFPENTNCINLTPNTRYTVRFDSRQGSLGRTTMEFTAIQIIGPGFRNVTDFHLVEGQKVFVTFNGREVSGEVVEHDGSEDVLIRIIPPGSDESIHLTKKIEEVRLLESRKSARLADQDTDFARLADMAGDRKRAASNTIDVPAPSYHNITAEGGYTHIITPDSLDMAIVPAKDVSRKRRPSFSDDGLREDDQMDECHAALVLMRLSASPKTSTFTAWGGASPSSSSSSCSVASWRSSPSPPPGPPNPHGNFSGSPSSLDEGIVLDYKEERHKKKKLLRKAAFQCTFPNCHMKMRTTDAIKAHIRKSHYTTEQEPGDEEFYYTDAEDDEEEVHHHQHPTLSHRDLARPPHEDPEFQRQFVGSMRLQFLSTGTNNINTQAPYKQIKLQQRPPSPKNIATARRVRGENKKCRKIYGMDNKEQWCTQCKWKKACTRFGDC